MEKSQNSDQPSLPIDQNDQTMGNTIPSSENRLQKRVRGYVFTLNNFDQNDQENLKILSNRPDVDWMLVGKEIGKLNGTPHLQGAIYYKTKKSFHQVKEDIGNKAHIEQMKGKKENQRYCEKEGNVIIRKNFPEDQSGTWKLKDPMEDKIPYEWQEKLLTEIIPYKEDLRKIIWYVDEHGGKGKSTLQKHLISTQNALCIAGSSKDIFSAIATMKKNEQPAPLYILLNVTRQSKGLISYSALEQLKDGFFFNQKYESGMITLRDSPTIIVFANEHPVYEMLTEDRWDVRTL